MMLRERKRDEEAKPCESRERAKQDHCQREGAKEYSFQMSNFHSMNLDWQNLAKRAAFWLKRIELPIV